MDKETLARLEKKTETLERIATALEHIETDLYKISEVMRDEHKRS